MKKGNPILAEKLTQLFNFEKQKPILDMPDLLQLQKQSYRNFLEKGLQEIFEEIFPIRDQNYVLEYIGHETKHRSTTYRNVKTKVSTMVGFSS
jgi:DNA-directed RNA polymerase subunit beta